MNSDVYSAAAASTNQSCFLTTLMMHQRRNKQRILWGSFLVPIIAVTRTANSAHIAVYTQGHTSHIWLGADAPFLNRK